MILVLNMLLQPIYCGVIRLLKLQSYRSILLINNPLVIYEESHILFLFNFLYNLFFYTDRVYCFVTKRNVARVHYRDKRVVTNFEPYNIHK